MRPWQNGVLMTVKELYELFCERIPEDLSEEWDNDGIMCCPDTEREVGRVLLSLDVTDEIVDYAVKGGFDLIISHHPLVFHKLSGINAEDHVSRKLMRLITEGISVFSFHTRADRVQGGVNDCLARLLGLTDVQPLGESGLGRIGRLEGSDVTSIEDFAYRVKSVLGQERLLVSSAYCPVKCVAVVGGDGKDCLKEAIFEGADTFVSGRIGYNIMEEAPEMGINMIEAGHYATEFPVLSFFSALLRKFDARIYSETVSSYVIRTV